MTRSQEYSISIMLESAGEKGYSMRSHANGNPSPPSPPSLPIPQQQDRRLLSPLDAWEVVTNNWSHSVNNASAKPDLGTSGDFGGDYCGGDCSDGVDGSVKMAVPNTGAGAGARGGGQSLFRYELCSLALSQCREWESSMQIDFVMSRLSAASFLLVFLLPSFYSRPPYFNCLLKCILYYSHTWSLYKSSKGRSAGWFCSWHRLK